jgi:cyanophycinase-like exopeptidase
MSDLRTTFPVTSNYSTLRRISHCMRKKTIEWDVRHEGRGSEVPVTVSQSSCMSFTANTQRQTSALERAISNVYHNGKGWFAGTWGGGVLNDHIITGGCSQDKLRNKRCLWPRIKPLKRNRRELKLTRTGTLKNAVFLEVTPCGSCKNRRFEGT